METGLWRLSGGPSETPEELGIGKCPSEVARRKFIPGQGHLRGSRRGKLLSPARRREAVVNMQQRLQVSERRACRVLKYCRATQRYMPNRSDKAEKVRAKTIELARTPMGGMGIAGSRPSYNGKAGPLIINAWKGYGARKG